MKRLWRILTTTSSAVCLLLVGLLLTACILKNPRGIRYQRTDVLISPQGRLPTRYFYSGGIRAWRIEVSDWHNQNYITEIRQFRDFYQELIERHRSNAASSDKNTAAQKSIERQLALRKPAFESLERSRILERDGFFYVEKDTHISPRLTQTKSFASIKFERGANPPFDAQSRRLTIPVWFVAPLLLVMPLVQMRALWRSWHRRRQRLCNGCGYDLRASRERCPECGATIISESVEEATTTVGTGP